MRTLSRALICLALVAGLTAPAFAQGVTTGAIGGDVTDQDGSTALPGASVTAVHVPTGTRYNTVSRADGRYNILNVRVGGPYTISASLDGFQTVEDNDIFVQLGQETDVNFELPLATIEETVTVVGVSNPLINSGKTGASSQVSTEMVENLPTLSRGIEELTRTNPFFTVASENEDPDSISVAGQNSRYNNIQIDGAVNNDLFGLADTGTPGGQAATTPISLDAIQELQLVLAPFDVRQGGFAGGGVNAITRSGTNQYSGSIFYFNRDDGLVGDGPSNLGPLGTFEEEQYGFRVGGPISQDKIFFFVNGEISERSEPTGWSIDGSGGQAFGGDENAAVQAEAQRFRQLLLDRYGFDPGGLGQQILETPSDKFFGRLDFNLNAGNNLTVRHNYVDAENDINRPSSFTYEFPSETYLFQNETNSTVAQLNSVFGANMFNELRITYQTIKDRRGPPGGNRFPFIEIEDVLGDGTGLEFEVGTEPFSTRNALDQEILEITNDFTWLSGNHTITIGTHNEIFSFDNLFIQNAFGAYEFRTVDDFEAGISRRYNFTQVNPGQSDSQKFDVTQLGLYAGDQWAARPNLTVTYGLRVDVPFFPDEPSRNTFTEETYGVRTDVLPDGEMLWSPRLGFNWDINGDGLQQLRGGTGLFAGRTPYVWISNQYARTGIEQAFIQGFGVPFEPNPDNQPQDFGGASTGEFNLIDPDFEFPQVWRVNLAYDRQLPWWGLVGSIEAIYGDIQQDIDYRDLNLVQTGETVPFDGRPIYTRLDSSVSGAYLITNTDQGDHTNVAIKLERPFRDGLAGFVAYAWGESNTVNDGTSSRAVSNFQFTEAVDPNNAGVSTSDFEVEHRITASLTYRADWGGSRWGTTFSGFYNHQSGRPFSYIYGFQAFPSVNEDRYFSNDLLYVPSSADDVVINGDGTWEQLDSYISSQPCLNSNRGGIAPRNCGQAPWFHTFDLHVAQEIPISGTNIEVTLDILNLMNMLDSDSGVLRYANFNAVSPVTYDGTTADGKPEYSLANFVRNPEGSDQFQTHNLRSRWRAKLGVRWSF